MSTSDPHETGTTPDPQDTAAAPGTVAGHAEPTAIETPPTAVTVTASWPRTIAALAVVGLLLLSFVAPASGATPRTTLESVEKELMCVTCRTPLNQSSAAQADRERREIQRLVNAGKTKQQAIDGMVAAYGNQVLLNPPEKGVREARVAVPAAAAVFGVLLLFVLIRRWRRRSADAGDDDPGPDSGPDHESSSPGLTDDDRRRLDAELERYA